MIAPSCPAKKHKEPCDDDRCRGAVCAKTEGAAARCESLCPDNLARRGERCELPSGHDDPHRVEIAPWPEGTGSTWLDAEVDDDWQSGPLPVSIPGDPAESAFWRFDKARKPPMAQSDRDAFKAEGRGLWRAGYEAARNEREPVDDSLSYWMLERIVGEVQQALAGKPAEQCVTDEGRAVAAVRDHVLDAAQSTHYGDSREALLGCAKANAAVAALCAEKGWKP